jgi:nucleoid-associated protein YgaU
MRGKLWLGSSVALLVVAVAIVAAVELRGTAPPPAQTAAPPGPTAASSPAAPTPAQPAPSFDVVTVDPQGHAVIAGRAAPGDRVRVLDGNTSIGEVTADDRGEWVLLPSQPIAPGPHQLALEARAPEAGQPRRSADVVALSVAPPSSGQGAPTALALLLPGDANRPARVLQQPGSVGAAGHTLSLDSAEFDAGNQLTLSGRATPGTQLNVYAGQTLLGTPTADNAGKWSLTTTYAQPSSGVELRLQELASAGGAAHQLTVPLAPPTAGGTYVVARGNSLWTIARRAYGDGARYTAIYRANREQIQDPDRIYPGQQFKVPKS